MFKNAIRLPFKIFGIPIQIDISFLVFLPIIAWMIGSNLTQIAEMLELEVDLTPLTTGARPFVIGLVAALGLFFSVLVHEVGHSVVAHRYHVKVTSITLWILGGLAQIEEMPQKKGVEAIIAIAGPITSFALGGVFWGLLLLEPATPELIFLLSYLFFMNWFLALFNLIPALPLDGGRVLRSLLALRISYAQATQVSASISKVFAFLLGFLGVVNMNFVLILIAFFVYAAGRGEEAAVSVRESLRGLLVGDLMSHPVDSVYGHTSVAELMEKMLHDRYLGFPVLDLHGALVGMVSLEDVKRRGPISEMPPETRVSDIMRAPAPVLRTDDTAFDAFERITQDRLDRVAVIDASSQLVGIISNTDLVRAVQIKMTQRPLGY